MSRPLLELEPSSYHLVVFPQPKLEAEPYRFVSYPELKPSFGIPYCRVHLARLERKDAFPKRVQLSDGRIAWYRHEIVEWMKNRPKAMAKRKAVKL